MAKKGQQVAGIDIGTTKICTAIATAEEDGPRILSAGVSKSVGLKQGFVSNLALTIESVKKSIQQAEERSERTIDSAWVSVSGEYITGINRHGGTSIREIKGKAGRITPEDIDKAVVLGLNYPNGPLTFGEVLGPRNILRILDSLICFYGDPRYRASPWLRRRALLGMSLFAKEI